VVEDSKRQDETRRQVLVWNKCEDCKTWRTDHLSVVSQTDARILQVY